ncbi:MAG: hypothetical protein ABJL99_11410 [Aliishimia sp.]
MKDQTAPRATDAIDQTTALFAEMEPPLQKVLNGFLAELSGFSDLVAQFAQPGPGQFHGYDGIENRGDVSDILASDWALYDLDQTEFLRRLAMRETMFRRKSYETETSDRAMCLIVDSGAWMLGQNRLLALGALFWLAAVAARQGLEFLWCETADQTQWHAGLERGQIAGYLGHVAQRELDQSMLNRMLGRLPVDAGTETDVWVIGPAGLEHRVDMGDVRAGLLAELPRRANDQTTTTSDVTLWSNGVLRRTLPIVYPDDGLCVGALRRPFAYSSLAAKTPTAHLQTGWAAQHWVELSGEKLAVRWPEGLLVLSSPQSQDKDAIWVPLDKDTRIIGLSLIASKLLILRSTEDNAALVLSSLNTKERRRDDHLFRFDISADDVNLDFTTTDLPVQSFGQDGNLNKDLPMYDKFGKPFLFSVKTGIVQIVEDDAHVLAKDASNVLTTKTVQDFTQPLLEISSKNGIRYASLNISDSEVLRHEPAHVLLATSDKAAMLSSDGTYYRLWDTTSEGQIQMPLGIVPIQMMGPKKGFAYDFGSGAIVQYRAYPSGKTQLSPKTHKGTYKGLSHIRSAISGRFAYGVKLTDGKPEELTLLRLGGKGPGFETIDIAQKIAEARTVWSKD